ncbi:hypothetical protein M514_02550 [Trichuris suis]|uniref:Uncharacterized protein n=1 Tax=Trichuris suis TaxID=68888 RepID=A0A085NNC7_9BILA|nr:hypothetical protein M513_02550 [Trichuris suis]KFD70973.1 hypothetical protein M514_02550 [Trichuris suis]
MRRPPFFSSMFYKFERKDAINQLIDITAAALLTLTSMDKGNYSIATHKLAVPLTWVTYEWVIDHELQQQRVAAPRETKASGQHPLPYVTNT